MRDEVHPQMSGDARAAADAGESGDPRDPQDAPDPGSDGLPAFVQGTGPAAVYLPGLSFNHGVPTGPLRALESGLLGPLSGAVTLHWTGRRVGVPAGFTVADLAADYAAHIREHFDGPVPVIGFSTGGFIGFQLALDHPDVVRRLVVVASDARISEATRAFNVRWIEHLERGDVAAAWQAMGAEQVADPGAPGWVGALLSEVAARLTPDTWTDGLRTAQAELDFDVTADLGRIATPTLMVVGTGDDSTSPGAAMRTQAALPDAELMVVPHTGHLGTLLDPAAIIRIRDFVRG